MRELEQPPSRAAYVLALSSAPGVGPWTAVAAMRAFPDPSALFAASPAERAEAIGRRFAGKLTSISANDWPALLKQAADQVAHHERKGIRVVSIDDEGYPPLMRLAPSPAAVLYLRGSVDAVRSDETVAVVGTRKPTTDGAKVARRLAQVLGGAGFVVVSGLADGIDQAGHEGALDAGGTTVAVLGTGIDKIYPARNRPLAERIVASGGTLISEYPIGFPTSGRHFVERDRLQAAMSIAVVAVQTGVEGGTLHTVRFASEAHRPVLVPKPLVAEADHPMYGGIHELVSRGAAAVIETQDDYPRLFEFLRAYRDWLLDGTLPRPAFGAQAAAATADIEEQPNLGL